MNFATFRNMAFLMLKYWSPLTLFLGYLPLPFMGTEERSGANLHFLCLSQTWVSMFVQRIKISDSPREWLTLCLGTAGSWTPCHLISVRNVQFPLGIVAWFQLFQGLWSCCVIWGRSGGLRFERKCQMRPRKTDLVSGSIKKALEHL